MPKQDDTKVMIYPILQTIVIKCADAGNAAGWSVVLHDSVISLKCMLLGGQHEMQVALQVHENSSKC